MDGTEGPGGYRAFISYSHRDAVFGRRLHRRLEGYRLPRRLAGRVGARGPAPRRLVPIFRDREELPAAHDLTAQVRAALAASDSLVVVCSPNARGSPWVSREVEVFRALHPARPVLAALIDGEPPEAFPEPLRTGEVEPLAADFRKGRDGPRLGLLKLVAGIAGVGLDQLVQRDAQRRLRGVTAVTAGALLLALGMGGLAAFALQQRAEAERQRAEAEGLIEFMLTDLRDKLEGVGRLDVLTSANERALAYYAKQDLRSLAPESLQRRAAILHAVGEDQMRRDAAERARAHFREAHRTTAALLARQPEHAGRLYAHGQSEYWLAYLDFTSGDAERAKPGFERYRRLAADMVRLAPENPIHTRELGYAEGNLCTLALQQARSAPAGRARRAFVSEAFPRCRSSLASMQAASQTSGGRAVALDVANRHGWLADAYAMAEDEAAARAQRLRQEQILSELMTADPRNVLVKDQWIGAQRSLARFDRNSGRYAEARARLSRAQAVLQEMIALEPENAVRVALAAKLDADLKKIEEREKGESRR